MSRSRLLLPGIGALLLCACGGAVGEGEATFAIDQQALLSRGLLSLTVEPYAGEDVNGRLLDCDFLIDSYNASTDFVPLVTSQIVNLSGENAVTLEVLDLSPGIAFFLVLGHDELDALGAITHVGCGEGVIRRGEKTPVTVALLPVP